MPTHTVDVAIVGARSPASLKRYGRTRAIDRMCHQLFVSTTCCATTRRRPISHPPPESGTRATCKRGIAVVSHRGATGLSRSSWAFPPWAFQNEVRSARTRIRTFRTSRAGHRECSRGHRCHGRCHQWPRVMLDTTVARRRLLTPTTGPHGSRHTTTAADGAQ
jgi:hypothetical protein